MMLRTKAALIRRPGYPVGQPAPCFMRCCNHEIDAPSDGETAACPSCGTEYDSRGWATPKASEPEMCFCVPGEWSIIDMVRADGRSHIQGETLEQVRQRYPGAIVKPIDEFCAEKAKAQDTPIEWTETTEDRFENMLGCVPPALMLGGGFLVGEAFDHHAGSGRPRYSAFVQRGDKFFASSRPLTVAEFREVMK